MYHRDRQARSPTYFGSPEKPSTRSSSIFTRSSSPSSTGSYSDLASTLDLKDTKYGYHSLPSSSRSLKTGLVNSKNALNPPNSVVLGVCAIDIKARSKAMREILTRLVERARGAIEVKVFGDKVILDEGEHLRTLLLPCFRHLAKVFTLNITLRRRELATMRHSHLLLFHRLSFGQGHILCQVAEPLLHQ